MAEKTKEWNSLLSDKEPEELRKSILQVMLSKKGKRVAVAEKFGISLRTLNRYIADLGLYADLDRLGLVSRKGPPRANESHAETRDVKVLRHIKKNKGEIDYSKLAIEMYGKASDKTVHRCYQTLTEMKAAGKIALDGARWFVV